MLERFHQATIFINGPFVVVITPDGTATLRFGFADTPEILQALEHLELNDDTAGLFIPPAYRENFDEDILHVVLSEAGATSEQIDEVRFEFQESEGGWLWNAAPQEVAMVLKKHGLAPDVIERAVATDWRPWSALEEAAVETLRAWVQARDPWRAAVHEAALPWQLTSTDPKHAVRELLQIQSRLSLNPAVSDAAAALQRGPLRRAHEPGTRLTSAHLSRAQLVRTVMQLRGALYDKHREPADIESLLHATAFDVAPEDDDAP